MYLMGDCWSLQDKSNWQLSIKLPAVDKAFRYHKKKESRGTTQRKPTTIN